jgi:hypothetical protein
MGERLAEIMIVVVARRVNYFHLQTALNTFRVEVGSLARLCSGCQSP